MVRTAQIFSWEFGCSLHVQGWPPTEGCEGPRPVCSLHTRGWSRRHRLRPAPSALSLPAGVAPVLDRVSFHVSATGLTALVGHSGTGRPTVLTLINRLAHPDRGEIRMLGRTVGN
ncbi:ATP-binding cassette domain-containing protein [Streptomyces mirabilis]|uniref:ATP-binding cassette domain-containing protein n=1 Tax=Streptomyces mirabilis TaxID=68239 RepID=UPI003809A50B